jgi:hypothetical protein
MVVDMVIGDSIAFGQGVSDPNRATSGIGLTDWSSTLSNWENRDAGLIDNGRGFHPCQSPFWLWPGTPWSNPGSATTTIGPQPYVSVNTSGGSVWDTRQFRRAWVIVARQTTGATFTVSAGVANYQAGAVANPSGTLWTIALADVTGLQIGQVCQGTGITGGAPITDVTDNVVTVNLAGGGTGPVTGDSYQFNYSSPTTVSAGSSGYVIVDTGDFGTAATRSLFVSQVSGAAGGVVVVGAIYSQGSGEQGHALLNIAEGGSTAQEWAGGSGTPYVGWDTLMGMILPRRLYVLVGINDVNNIGRTVSQIQGDITTIVNLARAASPLTEIVLISPWRAGSPCQLAAASWPTLQAAYAAVAVAAPCTLLDLYERFGDVSTNPASGPADPYGFTGDHLHPADHLNNPAGGDTHRAFALWMRERLRFDKGPQAQPIAPGWTSEPLPWLRWSATELAMTTLVDLSQKYAKGTKLRWAEGGIVKYGVVASSTYSPRLTQTITNVTIGATPTVTATAHGFTTGDQVDLEGFAAGISGIAGRWTITVTGANTFTVPTTSTGTYNGGGTATPLNMLLNLVPTTDYTVGADPDQNTNVYSYQRAPDFPSYFTWSNIALTGYSTLPVAVVARWSINNGYCEVTLDTVSTGGNGVSNATTLTGTLPITPADVGFAVGLAEDNGLGCRAQANVTGNNNTITFNKVGEWTTTSFNGSPGTLASLGSLLSLASAIPNNAPTAGQGTILAGGTVHTFTYTGVSGGLVLTGVTYSAPTTDSVAAAAGITYGPSSTYGTVPWTASGQKGVQVAVRYPI